MSGLVNPRYNNNPIILLYKTGVGKKSVSDEDNLQPGEKIMFVHVCS